MNELFFFLVFELCCRDWKEMVWDAFVYVPFSGEPVCTKNIYGIRAVVACLPAWFRFAQCLRRYRDTKLMFPHVVNAGKYSTTFFVQLFSTLYRVHIGGFCLCAFCLCVFCLDVFCFVCVLFVCALFVCTLLMCILFCVLFVCVLYSLCAFCLCVFCLWTVCLYAFYLHAFSCRKCPDTQELAWPSGQDSWLETEKLQFKSWFYRVPYPLFS